jgi:hypothetical protein
MNVHVLFLKIHGPCLKIRVRHHEKHDLPLLRSFLLLREALKRILSSNCLSCFFPCCFRLSDCCPLFLKMNHPCFLSDLLKSCYRKILCLHHGMHDRPWLLFCELLHVA